MSWKLEKKWQVVSWPPYLVRYEWELFQSAYGYAYGATFRRRAAVNQMHRVQSEWFAER